MIEPDTGCLERFRLRDRAGHTVEDVALRTIGFGKTLGDNADDDLIGHQMAFIHIGLGLYSRRRAVFDGRAQNVSGGDRRDPELGGEDRGLCALSRAGSAQ